MTGVPLALTTLCAAHHEELVRRLVATSHRPPAQEHPARLHTHTDNISAFSHHYTLIHVIHYALVCHDLHIACPQTVTWKIVQRIHMEEAQL